MQPALKHIGDTARYHLTHWIVAEAILAAADAPSGRLDAAQHAMAELPRAAPQPHPSNAKDWMPRLRRSDGIRRYVAANRVAGMPE